ncbi:MAG: SGNH/GDSL hydrolase family protein [Deltaproteobacteria bacterium]|nr:SGNH/GDSL hydrolase family protein [Deltaproteobacteria bacterium]
MVLALLAFPCCDGPARPAPAATPLAPEPVTILPTDPAIRTVGRFDRSDARILRFSWPATSFELRFTGTSVALVLCDTPLPDDTPETDWLALAIDGRELAPLPLAAGVRTYEVARGLAQGVHEIVANKRTEPEVGTVALRGVVLDPGAKALPPGPAPTRRMEIVGDSISTGFGIDGKTPGCPFTTATEDATRTYGVLAARALGADVQVIAWKGKGVLRNDDPADTETLPVIYGRTLPGDPGSRDAPPFDADVVVLNLGTNDFARSQAPAKEFEAAYDGFVGVLRARHPRALLVLAIGPLLFDEPGRMWRTAVKDVIDSVILERGRAGDARLALLDVWFDPADGVGCQFHPNLITHRKIAAELVRIVEARLGWKAGPMP